MLAESEDVMRYVYLLSAGISNKDLCIRIRKSANVDYTDYLDFTASTFG